MARSDWSSGGWRGRWRLRQAGWDPGSAGGPARGSGSWPPPRLHGGSRRQLHDCGRRRPASSRKGGRRGASKAKSSSGRTEPRAQAPLNDNRLQRDTCSRGRGLGRDDSSPNREDRARAALRPEPTSGPVEDQVGKRTVRREFDVAAVLADVRRCRAAGEKNGNAESSADLGAIALGQVQVRQTCYLLGNDAKVTRGGSRRGQRLAGGRGPAGVRRRPRHRMTPRRGRLFQPFTRRTRRPHGIRSGQDRLAITGTSAAC